MKKLLFLVCTVAAFSNLNSQTAAAAKAAGVGANVSVRGVCINGPELGVIRYVQDVTGGLAGYGNNLSGLSKGDSVIISGTLTEFKNLLEITPATFIYISSNATIPAPQVITASQFGEPHEGKLVKVMNCTFGTTGTFASAMNYTVMSNGQPLVVRSNSVIAGQAIPTGSVNIVGVGSQFCNSPTTGCTEGYQLLIREMTDITAYTAPTVTTDISVNTLNTFVSVFPNPASSTLSFKMDDNSKTTSVKVSDIFGRIVLSSDENISSIDVSTLAKGVYSLSVSTEKNNYKSKFIVE